MKIRQFLVTLAAVVVFLVAPFAASAQKGGGGVDFDLQMRAYDLVDIQELAPGVLVELKYSTEDNFVGKDMYGTLERAYLVPAFAERVVKAQEILQRRNPNYTLLIYDAARPISVQRAMRRIVDGTEWESFVADGTKGGRHNFGVAVDLTIATLDGTPLDMGADFDEFSERSSVKGTPDSSDPATRTIDVYRSFVRGLQTSGVITKEQADNRILLLEVMCEAGLVPYRLEWWHFEYLESISTTRSKYKLLDF
ncbi:MAG: M15 family metallopeptidase [Tidjanibacter sp.]|nr:M15 family metallopeptidase [Tidjanibacter sp.]